MYSITPGQKNMTTVTPAIRRALVAPSKTFVDDAVVQFVLEFLSRQLLSGAQRARWYSADSYLLHKFRSNEDDDNDDDEKEKFKRVWTWAPVDVLSHDVLAFPVCVGCSHGQTGHWFLVLVFVRQEQIVVVDSLVGADQRQIDDQHRQMIVAVRQYLRQLWRFHSLLLRPVTDQDRDTQARYLKKKKLQRVDQLPNPGPEPAFLSAAEDKQQQQQHVWLLRGPQQTNLIECGWYMLLAAELTALSPDDILKAARQQTDWSGWFSHDDLETKAQFWRDVLRDLSG